MISEVTLEMVRYIAHLESEIDKQNKLIAFLEERLDGQQASDTSKNPMLPFSIGGEVGTPLMFAGDDLAAEEPEHGDHP